MRITAPAARRAAIAPGTAPAISRTTIASQGAQRPPGARSERHRLPAEDRRVIDDEHVGVGEMPVERDPRALQEQRVANGQLGLAGDLLALALNRQQDEIAALCRHSSEHRLPDQRRSRRNHHLGHAARFREKRAGCVLDSVLRGERVGVVGEVARDRLGAAVRQQPLAEGDDDGDRPDDEGDANQGELHETDRPRHRHRRPHRR